jgi:hypothetical protein
VFSFKDYTFYAQSSLARYKKLRIQNGWGELTTNDERSYGIGARFFTATPSGSDLTLVNNTRGLVVGQQVDIGSGTSYTITGISGATVTLNTTAPVGGNYYAYDILEVNGTKYRMADSVNGAPAFYQSLCGFSRWSTGAASSAINVVMSASDDEVFRRNSSPIQVYGCDIILSVPFAHSDTLTLRATNESNYSPKLPAISGTAVSGDVDTRLNRVVWSKLGQPEAIEPTSEIYVGSGTFYRAVVRRDSVLCFCSDGLWILTGDSGNWIADIIDSTILLSSRAAVCQLDGIVYAYTSRGLVAVTEGNTVVNISEGLIGDVLPGKVFADTWTLYMEADEANMDVWLFDVTNTGKAWVYNVASKAFTSCDGYLENDTTALSYNVYEGALIFAAAPGAGTAVTKKFSSSTYRTDSSLVFQAFTGDGNAFMVKQWSDVSWLFRTGNGAGSGVNFSLSYNGTTSHTQATVTNGPDYRLTAGVGRAYAIAPNLSPGIAATVTAAATLGWALVGISPRFTVLGEEYLR